MENPGTKAKPFLGGWRSKHTGIIYYNSCTQTDRSNRKSEKRVQTDFTVDKFTNVKHNVGLQTNFFPDVRDRIVGCSLKDPSSMDRSSDDSTSSFEQLNSEDPTSNDPSLKELNFEDPSFEDPSQEKILESVVKIQRFYRARRGQRTATTWSASASPKNTYRWQTQPEPGFYRGRDFVILNRTSPRTKADFELLYNLLDRWRASETRTAREQLFEPSRIALGSLILSKEVELLRAIDRMKTRAKTSKRERSYRRFLDELSKPVLWRDSRGEPILVDTVRVQRARRFRDTFDELSRENRGESERREFLDKLRKDMETHTCRESNEVIRLLDQETDLLARNVEESKLHWLRSRLKMAFLRLAREALKQEYRDLSLNDSLRCSYRTICRSCGRLLPLGKFPRAEGRRSTSCNYCLYVKASVGPRIVYEPYQRLLRDVRRQEVRLHCCTSVAFVIDARVVYRLVNDIWQGRSAISENDHLEELRLVRFRNDEEWSPWNCLLLTAREASLHRKVEDLEKFYGAMILQKFYAKNLQAKLRFVAELKSVYGEGEYD